MAKTKSKNVKNKQGKAKSGNKQIDRFLASAKDAIIIARDIVGVLALLAGTTVASRRKGAQKEWLRSNWTQVREALMNDPRLKSVTPMLQKSEPPAPQADHYPMALMKASELNSNWYKLGVSESDMADNLVYEDETTRIWRFNFNPGNAALFPISSQLSLPYNRWRSEQLKIELLSKNSALEDGQGIIAFCSDPADEIDLDRPITWLQNMKKSVSKPLKASSVSMTIKRGNDYNSKTYFVDHGEGAADQDSYNAGTVYVAVTGVKENDVASYTMKAHAPFEFMDVGLPTEPIAENTTIYEIGGYTGTATDGESKIYNVKYADYAANRNAMGIKADSLGFMIIPPGQYQFTIDYSVRWTGVSDADGVTFIVMLAHKDVGGVDITYDIKEDDVPGIGTTTFNKTYTFNYHVNFTKTKLVNFLAEFYRTRFAGSTNPTIITSPTTITRTSHLVIKYD